MESSLSFATTPLALASLAIIAGIGILKLIVAGKNNALNRLITHYGFIVVIAFGLLGNAAYIYNSYQTSETIVLGSVVDENGNYLPNVLIDTGGHARGMTSDTGDFVLAIPASRVRDSYEISAALGGYERSVKTVKGESRMFARFELKKKNILSSDVLKLSDAEIIVGHYMGLPELYLPIRIENPGTSLLSLSNFSLELEAPSGSIRQLAHTNSAASLNSPMGAPLPQIQVKPGDQFSWVNVFVQYDNQIQQISAQAIQALQAVPDFRQAGPKAGQQYISSGLNDQIQSALSKNWFWEPGKTIIRLTCSANGTQYKLVRFISLSKEQIAAMKQSSDYYSGGYGIIFGFELTPVGSAQPGLKLTSTSG